MTPEQDLAIDGWKKGLNIFITGQGGTGKTAVIKHIVDEYPTARVTALTGCAAVLLGESATTLHSWAGIGVNAEFCGSSAAVSRWRNTDRLIIDEVSMMSKELFELLDTIGKRVRKSSKLFGGIQLLVSGDFFQLPPVEGAFCFESPLWAKFIPIFFERNFRQSDPVYQTILSEIRRGTLSKTSFKALKARVIDGDGFTRIVPTRAKADKINTDEYAALTGEERVFRMAVYRPHDESVQRELDYLEKNIRAPKELSLKVGARVMCIVNLKELDLCNGSQGVVVAFVGGNPQVRFKHTTAVMTPHMWSIKKNMSVGLKQIPLMLAWAITIHKSQGATLDTAKIDVGSDIFECGQTYVALSRVRALENLYLTHFDVSKIRLNPKVLEYYAALKTSSRPS
jgi:ATP-dependent DNA helicase PIF1